MPATLVEIFRDSETHHRLSLFDQPVLKASEAGLFEKNGKPLHTTASMYPAISTTDLMRVPFLLPDDATIKKVKQQITAAREAHALLERAKQAVETAIEKNEKAGMAML